MGLKDEVVVTYGSPIHTLCAHRFSPGTNPLQFTGQLDKSRRHVGYRAD